jgi:hypothetical protein
MINKARPGSVRENVPALMMRRAAARLARSPDAGTADAAANVKMLPRNSTSPMKWRSFRLPRMFHLRQNAITHGPPNTGVELRSSIMLG